MNVLTVRRLVVLIIALSVAATARVSASTTVPAVDVLATSPVVTTTDLQVLCLFRSSPKNKLGGALALTDNALHGLLAAVRGPGRFGGVLGETLLLTPPPGTMKAKHLMLIGLGDSETFSPERMQLVGNVLVREADRLHIAHPYFAPTIKDGGVTRYTTGQISEQVILGVRQAFALATYLKSKNANGGPYVAAITYLAGKEYAASTRDAIAKAMKAAAP